MWIFLGHFLNKNVDKSFPICTAFFRTARIASKLENRFCFFLKRPVTYVNADFSCQRSGRNEVHPSQQWSSFWRKLSVIVGEVRELYRVKLCHFMSEKYYDCSTQNIFTLVIQTILKLEGISIFKFNREQRCQNRRRTFIYLLSGINYYFIYWNFIISFKNPLRFRLLIFTSFLKVILKSCNTVCWKNGLKKKGNKTSYKDFIINKWTIMFY